MNAKTAKKLRWAATNFAHDDGVKFSRKIYRELKRHHRTKETPASKVSSTMPGIPVAKQASGFKGFRKKQPSYGPEIARWGVNRDRTHGHM
jgi:hypothetical protein